MSEYDMLQLPLSLAALTDGEIEFLLIDFHDRATAWQGKHCLAVHQLGAQLLFEQHRRSNNADEANPPIEARMVEFDRGQLDAKQAAIGLHVFNTRAKDEDQPAPVGELLDACCDAFIAVAISHLAAAYPDKAPAV